MGVGHALPALLALVAYSLNSVAYMSRVMTGDARLSGMTTSLLVGSFLVILGYLIVAASKASEVVAQVTEAAEAAKAPAVAEEEEGMSVVETVGIGLLALFFITSLFAGTNVTVQFYDPFAAVGYTTLFLSTWFPSLHLVGAVVLVLYYLFGAVRKLGKSEFTDRAQLFGRSALAVYYASAVLDRLTS